MPKMPVEHTHHHLVESSSTANGAHGGHNGTALVGQPIGMQNMLSVAINYNRQVQALALQALRRGKTTASTSGAMSPGVLAAAFAQQPQYSLARPAPYVSPYGNMNGFAERRRRDSADSPSQLSTTNLYIKGLKKETTDHDLQNMCGVFGTITSTKAIMDKATNTCKGYGFVDFETAEAADAAAKSLNAQGLHAQMAKIRTQHAPADVPSVEQDPTNLYIANLPQAYSDTDLSEMLASYGLVISTRILRTPDGNSRGVGFARMESKEKCEEIIANLHNQPPPGHSGPPLQVKFADSGKKPRRNQLSHGALEPFISGIPSDLSGMVGLGAQGMQPNLQAGVFAGGNAAFQAQAARAYSNFTYMPQTMPQFAGAPAQQLLQSTPHSQGYTSQYSQPDQMTIDTSSLAQQQQMLAAQQFGMQQMPYMAAYGQQFMQPTHYVMQQPIMHNGYDASAVVNGQPVDYGAAQAQFVAQNTPAMNAAQAAGGARTNGSK